MCSKLDLFLSVKNKRWQIRLLANHDTEQLLGRCRTVLSLATFHKKDNLQWKSKHYSIVFLVSFVPYVHLNVLLPNFHAREAKWAGSWCTEKETERTCIILGQISRHPSASSSLERGLSSQYISANSFLRLVLTEQWGLCTTDKTGFVFHNLNCVFKKW